MSAAPSSRLLALRCTLISNEKVIQESKYVPTYLIILSQIVFGNPENIFSFCTFCTVLAKEFGNFQFVGILEPKAL